MKRRLICSAHGSARLDAARDWLRARAPAEEAVVVSATLSAASELLRDVARDRSAAFGWHRITLARLAGELARPYLVARDLVPIGALGAEALVARVLYDLGSAGLLGRYGEAAATPGFARAAARTVGELRMAGGDAAAHAAVPAELVRVLRAYETLLTERRLADRAVVFRLAAQAAASADTRLPGLPALLLDVPVWSSAEEALLGAHAARAPEMLATVPAGDEETVRRLDRAGFVREEPPGPPRPGSALERLAAHLFEEGSPPQVALDGSVAVLSAPGESRECVEIARQLLAAARSGVPFDRMAVLLRSVEEYRPHLEEAFARAGVPVHFAAGTLRPDAAGRAFLALIACAADGLSARRFAEYLSLSQVPEASPEGGPPAAPPSADRWVPPDEEMVPEVVAEALTAPEPSRAEPPSLDPESAPVTAGTLRAPRRWEQLLVDAAVIGGRDRWQRRLEGLDRELHLDLEEVEDPDGPEGERLRARIAELSALAAFALPLIDDLAALPEVAAWNVWIDRLSALATRSLGSPERVLALLAELAPMGDVGGVGLREVQLVLSRRLLEVAVPPPRSRYGRVCVAEAQLARGMVFDVVVLPGLAEKLFPREIREDPLLLDSVRGLLDPGLTTNAERVRRERLSLRLGVGAAANRLVISYPRLDLEKGRPRVPSFYGLEALRAAEGKLPGFADLASRAESVVETRVGWPAPEHPTDAIDEAEHDLALLAGILDQDEPGSIGTARYLLEANPHLGRALRFRARRWLRRWTPADGLVEPSGAALAALRAHGLAARSYSATALEHYAACPYRFFLQAIHRLAPREVPEPIDEMGALERGSLVHEIQFEFFSRLERDGGLPITGASLSKARGVLDSVIDSVSHRFREQLAPAIERVWEDGIAGVRADLREWLRRLAADDSGFVPSNFELAFGLASRRGRDRESRSGPAALDCGIQLRGSIDLVERHPAGRVRVTDHKTGKVRLAGDGIFGGGSVLQPVLYALAAEKLFPEAEVEEGRLFYCTSNGGFQIRSVPLDQSVRDSAEVLADAVGEALGEGFLPALPQARACTYCDYRVVCGPYEEFRTSRKPSGDRTLRLRRMREMP